MGVARTSPHLVRGGKMRDEKGRFVKGFKSAFAGRKHSEETKKKIGLKSVGRTFKLSEEAKEKIRKSRMGNLDGFPPGHKINLGRKGKNANHWKGGKVYSMAGYVYIYKPEHPFSNNIGYIFEHRLVMEQSIGRYLNKTEKIHHINEIKDDNRIENLLLFKNESEHQKYHNMIK